MAFPSFYVLVRLVEWVVSLLGPDDRVHSIVAAQAPDNHANVMHQDAQQPCGRPRPGRGVPKANSTVCHLCLILKLVDGPNTVKH